jgi:2-oxoglutarate ferredoxin oxidoreductase subunit delta
MTLTRGTITIAVEHCKGCELCIPACRPGVLVMSEAMNETGYRFPLLLDGCTACQACHAVCPDFVIDVYKYETPIWSADPDSPSVATAAPEET